MRLSILISLFCWFIYFEIDVISKNVQIKDKRSFISETNKMFYNNNDDTNTNNQLQDDDILPRKRSTDQKKIDYDEDNSEESCFKDTALILYYNFEKQRSARYRILDHSGCDNHGIMDVGTMVFTENNSSCGSVAYLWDQDIKIIASSFQNPPRYGITISMWVKLIWNNNSIKELFSVNGPHFGVLSLRVDIDALIWSYYRPNNSVVFSVVGYDIFPRLNLRRESNYTHIAATYNTKTGVAQIYHDGHIINRTVTSSTIPFGYWGNNVNIGGNFREMPIKGIVDEIKLFNYALDSATIDVLANECHFGSSKPTNKRSNIYLNDNYPYESSSLDTLEKDSLTREANIDDITLVDNNDQTLSEDDSDDDNNSNKFDNQDNTDTTPSNDY